MDYNMLRLLAKKNIYQCWRHTFTGYHKLTGETRAFFIEISLVNPKLSPQSVVFGLSQQIDTHKRIMKPSYVMIKAGAYGKGGKQINQFYPVDQLRFARKRFELKVGESYFSESELRGFVYMSNNDSAAPEYMSDSGGMKWNLQFQNLIPCAVKSEFLRTTQLRDIQWKIPGCKTQFAGNILFDGEEYVVHPQKSYGHVDFFSCSDFLNSSVWISSNNLISLISSKRLQHSCFEVGGFFGREKNKKIIVCFFHEGTEYKFNISNDFLKNKVSFDYYEAGNLCHWNVTAQNRKILIDIDITCNKDNMILLNHESPIKVPKLNRFLSGGNASGEIRLYKKVQKSLEIIEQARIENCNCLYGNN